MEGSATSVMGGLHCPWQERECVTTLWSMSGTGVCHDKSLSIVVLVLTASGRVVTEGVFYTEVDNGSLFHKGNRTQTVFCPHRTGKARIKFEGKGIFCASKN